MFSKNEELKLKKKQSFFFINFLIFTGYKSMITFLLFYSSYIKEKRKRVEIIFFK